MLFLLLRDSRIGGVREPRSRCRSLSVGQWSAPLYCDTTILRLVSYSPAVSLQKCCTVIIFATNQGRSVLLCGIIILALGGTTYRMPLLASCRHRREPPALSEQAHSSLVHDGDVER